MTEHAATIETARFTLALPEADRFAAALETEAHEPLPDDWQIAVTDVVGSRKAITAGRYKAVNMAGASAITAIMNALDSFDLPFVFGGDGAALALASSDVDGAAQALAATIVFAREELDLELRAALVPVADLRAAGADVRVEAVRISPAIRNFAFSGGGVALAERMMKDGRSAIAPAEPGSRPDLTGLSCRWTPIRPQGERIVSLIVEPAGSNMAAFAEAARQIVEQSGGSPMPPEGPGFTWPPAGLELEARASRAGKALSAQKRAIYMISFIAWLIDRIAVKIGGFDPVHYKRITGLNTDFRKVHDGLKMTLSLAPEPLAQLRSLLEGHRDAGILRFGICEQDEAVLTCFVPSFMNDDHFHFLDGAGGGYAAAATAMQ